MEKITEYIQSEKSTIWVYVCVSALLLVYFPVLISLLLTCALFRHDALRYVEAGHQVSVIMSYILSVLISMAAITISFYILYNLTTKKTIEKKYSVTFCVILFISELVVLLFSIGVSYFMFNVFRLLPQLVESVDVKFFLSRRAVEVLDSFISILSALNLPDMATLTNMFAVDDMLQTAVKPELFFILPALYKAVLTCTLCLLIFLNLVFIGSFLLILRRYVLPGKDEKVEIEYIEIHEKKEEKL